MMPCVSRFTLQCSWKVVHLVFLLSALLAVNSFAAQQAWVAKYSSSAISTNQAVAIGLDPWGNVLVAGSATGAGTGFDYVTLKYEPITGTQVWSRTYASPGNFDDRVRAMKVDSAGNVLLTGTSATIMYDPDGIALWTAPYGGRALAVDEQHVYVTGFSNSAFASVKLLKMNG